jgi:hypothetical protein
MTTEQRDGHVNWKSWAFDYNVAGTEALTLGNGYFRGRRVFHKLSLPVIRVKYVQDESVIPLPTEPNPIFGTGCGPYNDQISWDPADFGEDLNPIAGPHHLVKLSNCGSRYICIKESVSDGTPWFELGVYARIGSYHIYQSWYLNDGGQILPRVFSKGLSCNLDHWHHPYWRLDFDLDGADNQRVNIFGSGGSQFRGFVDREGRLFNESDGGTVYNVENLKSGLKAWIMPPRVNEELGIVGPTEFSNLDAYVRKYRESEDRPWPHRPEREIGFDVHENPDNSDVVFWSVSHLHHHAAEGKDHWHEVGPTIAFDVPPAPPPPPDSVRRVQVKGNIHIKDFKLVGNDLWGHYTFDESRTVHPFSPHAEVFVIKGPVGDVTTHLIVKLDRESDNTISVAFTGELYDEDERVSSVGSSFKVAPGETGAWSGIHLVDHHGGDPDTSDIDFTVTNSLGVMPGWQPPFPIAPAGHAQAGALDTVARTSQNLDVFWIGPDGGVGTTFWDGSWHAPFAIAPAGHAQAGALTALSREPGHLDVFWVGPDGGVGTAYWDGSWHAPFAIAPAGSAKPGALKAVSRTSQNLDVFWIGPDGGVGTTYWDGTWHAPFPIAPAGHAQGGALDVVSRFPEQLDVFWIGPDGGVGTTYWDGTWHVPFAIAPAGSAKPGALEAVSRFREQLDVFWIGPDGGVGTTYWTAG